MTKYAFLISSILIVFTACTKSEGQGGAAKITGKITAKDYNSFGTFIDTFPAQDEKVYIIYGTENNIVADEVSTSYDGTFEFNYLRKGTYTIFAYSDCVSCPNGEDSIAKITVEIADKNEEIILTDLIVRR